MAGDPRDAFVDVARSVLADLDLESVLHRLLSSARQLTGARYAAVGVLTPTADALERFVTQGLSDESRRRLGDLPRGRGVLGELIRHPVPLRLDDIGLHPASYGFPVGHPPMATFLGVPISVGGRPYGDLYLTEKVGGEAFTEDDERTIVQLAQLAGMAIDHARRFTRASARAADLKRTVAALDATVEIARTLAGHTDLDAILTLVAKRARALVSARVITVEHVNGDELVLAALAGDVPSDLRGRRLPLEGSVAATALRTGRTQHLEDATNHARFDHSGLGHLGVRAEAGLVVPLVLRGRSYGALVAVDRLRDGPAFTADDVRLLEAFASSAAASIATAQSVADGRRAQRFAAMELERRHWARELHDETLQNLAAVRLGLCAGARAADPADPLAQVVRHAVDDLQEEITTLRAIITDLRPAALDEVGTEAALNTLAARLGARGLDIHLAIDLDYEHGRSPHRHTPALETTMYRIVQEALSNAIQHGDARRAVVEVVDGPIVQVAIRDDGSGFDLHAQKHDDGFGVLGMRERAELLDGTLSVTSAPGQGTVVTARIPVQRRRAIDVHDGVEADGAAGC